MVRLDREEAVLVLEALATHRKWLQRTSPASDETFPFGDPVTELCERLEYEVAEMATSGEAR